MNGLLFHRVGLSFFLRTMSHNAIKVIVNSQAVEATIIQLGLENEPKEGCQEFCEQAVTFWASKLTFQSPVFQMSNVLDSL